MPQNNIFSLIVENSDNLIYLSDPDTYELLFLNKKLRDMYGVNETEYAGMPCYKLLQGFDAPCDFCTNGRLDPSGEAYLWERYNAVLERNFLLKDCLIPLDGKTVRMEICTDITDSEPVSRSLQRRLNSEETLVKCIQALSTAKDMQSATDSILEILCEFYDADRAYIFEFDHKGDILSNTYGWCKGAPSSKIEALGHIPMSAVLDWMESFEKEKGYVFLSSGADAEFDFLGHEFLNALNVKTLLLAPLLSGDKITGFLGVDAPGKNLDNASLLKSINYFVMDDIEKRKLIQKLQRMSYYDTLTGLYNRNKYVQTLNDLESEGPLSIGIVYLDINGLKNTNDTLGHQYGDHIIRHTANTLRKFFDRNIFRVGGDEFVVLCTDLEREDFEARVSAFRIHTDADKECSLSIGAVWNVDGMDTARQIIYADNLMYVEKQSYYKNKMDHPEASPSAPSHKEGMVCELLDAIQKGEYTVFLQPKIELNTSELIGAEALVRRYGANGEIILPGKFIPLFEAEGIIRHVDFFVFETICRTLKEWRDQGFPQIPVSVNFSRVTLMEHEVVENLLVICKNYNILPSLIDIEVTEGIGKIAAAALTELMRKLTQAGFSLSLDDFGSNFSNLSILSTMDFSTLKLDRSLIDDLENNPRSQAILKHTVKMCGDLNHTVSIAEGIETEAQKDLLQEYNCQYGQGFYFAKPMDIKSFVETYFK